MSSISVTPNEVQVPEGKSTQLAHLDDLPIAGKALNPDQAQAERPKYHYQEFEGLAGERYLLSLAEKFAPFALWRTWYAFVSYQASGSTCYVGVSRVVDPRKGRVGVRERKIYLDLQAMEDRGWLVMSRVRKPFLEEDGGIVYHPATDKDFTGFYETAHDYHLWMQDKANYIPPERENVPLILADAELTRRLIKFENYRRLLLCAKPGRKPQEQSEDYYSRQLAQIRTPIQEVKEYSNPHTNTLSSYRIDQVNSNQEIESSSSSTSKRGTALSPSTIRNTQTELYSNSKPEPNPPTTKTENGAAGDAAKDVRSTIGYTDEELRRDIKKRGAAAAGIPADQYAKLNGGQDRAEQEERNQRELEAQAHTQQTRQERERPAQIAAVIDPYARTYEDPEKIPGDITRANKLFFTAQQALDTFNETLFWAFYDEAKKAAGRHAHKHTNRLGRVNRVPYMFTCWENAFKFSLEELVFLRTEDPLYCEYGLWDVIDYLRNGYQEQINGGQTLLDYRQWLQSLLDQLEHCKEPKERNNPTTRDY